MSQKSEKVVHYYCGCRYRGTSPSAHCPIHQQGAQYSFQKDEDVLDSKEFLDTIKKDGGKLIKK